MGASVKVMRSYDYCHFEIALSKDGDLTDKEVDDLRKRAARLVDKAVMQYQIAKATKLTMFDVGRHIDTIRREAAILENKPEDQLTPAEKSTLKIWGDHNWRNYDYEDWEEEWNDGEPD